jgi:type IV pilus assembly protein PilM
VSGAALARGTEWVRRRFTEPERPLAAIEVRASAVGVVRVRRERGRLAVAAAASMELPPGTLALSLTQPNVVDGPRFRQALQGAMERAGVLGGAKVALVLPDTAARVALVPAVEVPAKKPGEVDELLRFRLRKVMPFEVRDARVAHAAGSRPGDVLMVAAAAGTVVAGYEEVCRSLGLAPGLVEVAGMALARAAFAGGAPGDGLLVNWDEGYLTLVLARDGWPILVRTLAGASVAGMADVQREISSTLVYYRERLGGEGLARAVVRSPVLAPEAALEALAPALKLVPESMDAWAPLGGAPAEASQALAGAAAALGAAE